MGVALLLLGGCTEDDAAHHAEEEALRAKAPVQTGSLNQAMGSGERVAPTLPTPQDRFVMALRIGDEAEAERWLESGALVDSGAGLVVAVRGTGTLDFVRWLVERGAPINQADAAGRTPLSWAAGKGRRDVVSYLLGRGAAIGQRDQLERTPLHYAVFGGDETVVALLLEADAEVDAQDRLGSTPLMYACAKNLPQVVAVLDRAGADRTIRDTLGRTATGRAHEPSGACGGTTPEHAESVE